MEWRGSYAVRFDRVPGIRAFQRRLGGRSLQHCAVHYDRGFNHKVHNHKTYNHETREEEKAAVKM